MGTFGEFAGTVDTQFGSENSKRLDGGEGDGVNGNKFREGGRDAIEEMNARWSDTLDNKGLAG